jgi:hypothetical protein
MTPRPNISIENNYYYPLKSRKHSQNMPNSDDGSQTASRNDINNMRMLMEKNNQQKAQKQPSPKNYNNAQVDKPETINPTTEQPRNVELEYNELSMPRQLPPKMSENNTSMEKFKDGDDNEFLMNVRFPHVRKTYGVSQNRILPAILRALQNAMPYTKILPTDPTSKAEPIVKDEDIKSDVKFTSQYLENPQLTTNEYYTTRIRILSKKPLLWIKRNRMFIMWLKKERFVFEENNLTEINVPKVGFLTNSFPRDSYKRTFEERLRKLIPDAPPFYCKTKNLSRIQIHVG